MGAIFPAMEDRLKALVLIGPGFYMEKRFPAADQINFAPRVKAPVLMLNGRFDFLFPTASSQEPMFHLLGTPQEHKRRVLYDTGHDDIPRSELIKETLNWLDRYLGLGEQGRVGFADAFRCASARSFQRHHHEHDPYSSTRPNVAGSGVTTGTADVTLKSPLAVGVPEMSE